MPKPIIVDGKSLNQHKKNGTLVWALFRRFHRQKSRCNNPNNSSFKWYGAKGIQVKYSLLEFIEWGLSNFKGTIKEFKSFHIGRIKHDNDYTLDNIEIQTSSENSKERIIRCGNPNGPK